MKKFLSILFLLILSITEANATRPGIDITFNDGIYHIILKGDSIKKKIMFVASENLITNKEAHQKYNSYLTVNAGFFDPKNEKTISYISNHRNTVADPLFNENITNNPILRQNLDKILNRTEFRVVECNEGKTILKYEIAPHKAPVDFACSVITSAQGGPLIYPELRMVEEFFVVKDEDDNVIRESASVLHKVARTIIATKGEDAHILIITDEHPMDLYEVQALCKKLGFDRAMGFDGGSSTSMNYLDKYNVISTKGDGAGRSLKSFLIIQRVNQKQ